MKPSRCPNCKRLHKRSHPQNARYWSLLHRMAEVIRPAGETYSAETWHLWAKSRFLGCEETRLPNGKIITTPNSTADLDVAAFADYMTQVEAFANDRGAYLEDTEIAA